MAACGTGCRGRRPRDAGLFQEFGVVVVRDDAADDDQDVAGAFGLQSRRSVAAPGSCGRRPGVETPIDVHIVLGRLAGGFGRGLEQRADIDVEAEIGESGGDDLGAPVVAVLAHLDDEQPRAAAFGAWRRPSIVAAGSRRRRRRRHRRRPRRPRSSVWARCGGCRPTSRAVEISPTVARARRRVDGQCQQVAPGPIVAASVRADRAACRCWGRGAACILVEPGNLGRRALLGVVDIEDVDGGVSSGAGYLFTPTTTSWPRSTRA